MCVHVCVVRVSVGQRNLNRDYKTVLSFFSSILPFNKHNSFYIWPPIFDAIPLKWVLCLLLNLVTLVFSVEQGKDDTRRFLKAS